MMFANFLHYFGYPVQFEDVNILYCCWNLKFQLTRDKNLRNKIVGNPEKHDVEVKERRNRGKVW